MTRTVRLAAIGSTLFAGAAVVAAPPRFDALGDLAGGNTRSAATAVNADGSVIVGYSDAATGEQAFRWTRPTGMYGLGSLGGVPVLSTGRAVSADGRIVFGDSVPPDEDPNSVALHAFRWTMSGNGPGGVMESMGELPGGDAFAIGAGCSADGNVLVGHSGSAASGSLGADAYRKVGNGPMVSIGDLAGGAYFSVSTACSADGSVIAGYSSSSMSGAPSSEVFRWTQASGMVALGDLAGGGFGSNAFAISADGSVIAGVGVDGTGVVAFRWTQASGMVSIGDLPDGSRSGRANGMSADGSIIVGQGHTTGNVFNAFIWDQTNGMRNLREVLLNDLGLTAVTNWRLEVAMAISADGLTVVGWGLNPQGFYEAWRAHLGNGCVLTGDTDFDDDVDLGDLSLLLSQFGQVGPGYEGDLDDDGDIDLADLALMLANFGATCP